MGDERGVEAAREDLSRIYADAAAFLASMEDREAKGPPVTLPDGSTARRLPGFKRWLWDGEFCGSIGLRWQPGTTALPPHCLGHIGYAVVPPTLLPVPEIAVDARVLLFAALITLGTLMLTDFYIMLVASGTISDLRFIG